MTIDRGELKKKVMEAASAEEIMEIIKAAGEEITAEEAAVLFEKAQKQKEDQELSIDELEAVSGGGEHRNWVTDGCAATVEYKSWCDSNDSCAFFDVTYDYEPTHTLCPNCGKHMYIQNKIGIDTVKYKTEYRCKFCGCITSKICYYPNY